MPRLEWERDRRPFQVLTVTSNKGGVGKTTVASNLAVYLRALREELPVLVIGFDDQNVLDQMFALDPLPPRETVVSAMRMGSFSSAIRVGQYGVHYVPTSDDVSELKQRIDDPFRLQGVLLETGWQGLVIIDTKSDLEILTQNAIAASDLAVVLVADHTSLKQAEKVFRLLEEWSLPRERARILLSLLDLRIKFKAGEQQDVLGLLVSEIRRRGYPLFEGFLSRSPRVESLHTNPDGRVHSILHGARNSIVHRQMRYLANDVLKTLGGVGRRAAPPNPRSESTHTRFG